MSRTMRAEPGRLRSVVLGGIVAIAAPASSVAAQDPGPVVTDRPDRTESAAVVTPGFVQVETGWTFTREREGSVEVTAHSLPETLVRVGVLPWLEGRVGIAGWQFTEAEAEDSPSVPTTSQSGFGDAFVGAKVRLVEGNGSRPAVALLGHLSLPVGEDPFGGERADPSVRATVAHELPAGLSLGWNVGVEWETVSDEFSLAEADGSAPASSSTRSDFSSTRSDVIYTVALGIPVAGPVGAFVEAFGALGVQEVRPDRHGLDGGLTLLLTESLQLDASAGFGLSDAADDLFLGAGLSFRLPR